MKSETIGNLAKALSIAQGQFEHAKKDSANPFFKSTYANLASVIDAAKKPLADNGLAVIQTTEIIDAEIVLETTLAHVSGEWINGNYPIRPIKNDPQSVGSAITYARRYAFSAITGIAADDDDGNAGSAPKKETKPENNPIINYKKELKECKTLSGLQVVWDSIPKAFHKGLQSVKDEMKVKLTDPKVNEFASRPDVDVLEEDMHHLNKPPL